ncbi:MAG: hypothetical protein KAT90_13010, partial [Gammaproteobacteria bacterium]|nr:hypothetical protein [Gammaproteobacteria bacterium]
VLFFSMGALWRSLHHKKKKSVTFAIFGGDAFQEKMLERKAKKKVKKKNKNNLAVKKGGKKGAADE